MLGRFKKKWVVPFYRDVLNGNYATDVLEPHEQAAFVTRVRAQREKVTPKVLERLLAGQWREAIVGSWFAGLCYVVELREQVGELLLASKTTFAGQGHTFALACFADEQSADFLVRYLDTYLRKLDCFYDQGWAMPALIWVDEQLDTSHAEQFLVPGGLWETFVKDAAAMTDAWTLDQCKARFWRCMLFCKQHSLRAGSPIVSG